MKNVRLFYKKSGPLKFVSHLDMNRFMTRLLRLSKVPVWYTEGFNKHPYITFALPLSLGFISEYEVMDFRLEDDNFSLEQAQKMIADVCPKGLEIIELFEPQNKSGKIALADFEITFSGDSKANKETLEKFFTGGKIVITKKTKKGELKQLDITDKIILKAVTNKNGKIVLSLRLPAGGGENINPKAVVDEYLNSITASGDFYSVNRKALLMQDGSLFR